MESSFFSSGKKLGILGAGQLGKMLLPTTQAWDIYTKMLDPDPDAPCSQSCNEFVCGSLQDYETVYQFGQDCDIITIEIEHVNADALLKLKSEGKIIHPDPAALKLIQDKGLQKLFYQQNEIITASFELYENKDQVLLDIQKRNLKIPFVQKSRTEGYDGKGVVVIKQESDLDKLLDGACVIEDAIDILTEIAVIVARNENGDITCYDASMMEFHEGANMLDMLLYPAPIAESIAQEAKETAKMIIEKLNICGLLAVEFLLDKQHQLWVNEVAPRPHNSGHQTIEASYTSQYEQHIRSILNLPLGSTKLLKPSAMFNILGEENNTGMVSYAGVKECMDQIGLYIHLYGKKITKPFRKMGHATVIHDSLDEAKKIAIWARQILKARSL